MSNALLQGTVGPLGGVISTKLLTSGTSAVARLGRQGSLIVDQAHGELFENTFNRSRFFATTEGGVTSSASTTTTYVGLCLSNPLASGMNLVLERVGYAFTVAFSGAAAIGLMGTANVSNENVGHTSAVSVFDNWLDATAGTSVGKADKQAALPTTPKILRIFDAGLTGAITTNPAGCAGMFEVKGGLIIPPGSFVCLYTSAASGTSGCFASMEWNEIPAS